jgi:hypothetical protein
VKERNFIMADNLVEKSPTFEKVAADVAARTAVDNDTTPRPDMPVSIAPPAYGDPGHVNPALNPAPAWAPPPDRVIVPVQNDPGLLGSPLSLADMNRSSRLTDHIMRGGKEDDFPDDPTRGVTHESNREAIRAAAEARLSDIEKRRDDAIGDAQERTQRSIDNANQNGGIVPEDRGGSRVPPPAASRPVSQG